MSHHHVEIERILTADPAEIWAVIDDTSRYAEWVDGCLEVTRHHGAATVGAEYAERNRTLGPLTTRSTWIVREIEHLRRRVDAGEGFAPLQDLVNTFELTPAEGGTRFVYRVDFRLSLGPLSSVVASILGRTLAAEFGRSLERLEQVVVSERPVGGVA